MKITRKEEQMLLEFHTQAEIDNMTEQDKYDILEEINVGRCADQWDSDMGLLDY